MLWASPAGCSTNRRRQLITSHAMQSSCQAPWCLLYTFSCHGCFCPKVLRMDLHLQNSANPPSIAVFDLAPAGIDSSSQSHLIMTTYSSLNTWTLISHYLINPHLASTHVLNHFQFSVNNHDSLQVSRQSRRDSKNLTFLYLTPKTSLIASSTSRTERIHASQPSSPIWYPWQQWNWYTYFLLSTYIEL